MFSRKLACSFCGRSEAAVAKLVAGPRVHICDQCAAEVIRIMDQASRIEDPSSASRRGLFRVMWIRIRGLWHRGVRRTSEQHPVARRIVPADYQRWHNDAARREESIPSLAADGWRASSRI
jgi:hypothetical protein